VFSDVFFLSCQLLEQQQPGLSQALNETPDFKGITQWRISRPWLSAEGRGWAGKQHLHEIQSKIA
jgi:hypothetical protein